MITISDIRYLEYWCCLLGKSSSLITLELNILLTHSIILKQVLLGNVVNMIHGRFNSSISRSIHGSFTRMPRKYQMLVGYKANHSRFAYFVTWNSSSSSGWEPAKPLGQFKDLIERFHKKKQSCEGITQIRYRRMSWTTTSLRHSLGSQLG